MISPLIRNLQQDISLLQTFINRRQAVGFYDMERMLEALTIQLFKALELADLKNKNQLHAHFPAIDLADDLKGVAVQVTSNASPAKIRKTIANFEKADSTGKSLRDQYSKLYIFGFCKASRNTVTPNYCEILSPDSIVNKLIDRADPNAVQDILEAIQRHQSYASLHPWDDKDCLEIILNTINRNAIKHQMSCEGSVGAMTDGLNEISELIGKGTIKRKETSKSINNFDDPQIRHFLREAMENIGRILAVVNSSSAHGVVNIDQRGKEQIDLIKRTIARDASAAAAKYGIPVNISTIAG